ncbi:MAG: o-succinylbenzoate synthase [Verrucomicrobiota bacterium]
MTTYALRHVTYRRPFAVPLRTAKGPWFEREGILLRLVSPDGRAGYGEIAPLEWFGTESLGEAEAWLQSLRGTVSDRQIEGTPEALRCSRFALSSARWQIREPGPGYDFLNCALLPTGEAALDAIGPLLEAGFRVFKLKVGVDEVEAELAVASALVSILPRGARLRLDGNARLAEEDLAQWWDHLEGVRPVEFIEQPLAVGKEARMHELALERTLPLALDESIASVGQLLRVFAQQPWKGPLVIKGSILGSVEAQRMALGGRGEQVIFSSVFETGIGLHSVLRLARAVGAVAPVGFGTLGYFEDELNGFTHGPALSSAEIEPEILDGIWEAVCSEFVRS